MDELGWESTAQSWTEYFEGTPSAAFDIRDRAIAQQIEDTLRDVGSVAVIPELESVKPTKVPIRHINRNFHGRYT